MRSTCLFAGPSANGVPKGLLTKGRTKLLPPVRRGDIDRLMRATTVPGIAIVCDGVFQSEPAVSHAELCRAIDAGWEVWGVSSIGAIRAYELRSEGMQGFGYVYSMFAELNDFADDEMCVLHFPEDPYFPVSEALVNVRYALRQNRQKLLISEAAEAAVLAQMRTLWFGDRTEDRIRSILINYGDMSAQHADTLLTWTARNRVKTIDLVNLMTSRPWSRRAQLSGVLRGERDG
jgi:hypothetical protein